MTNEHDDERQALITALYVVIAMFAVMSLVVSSVDGAEYTVRVESPSRYTVTVETPKESHDERETVLMFFAPFKCDACDQQQADTANWKDAPFKLKRGDNIKAPVKLDAYPVTAWKVKGRWWSYDGWYGREHLEKEWRRSHDAKAVSLSVRSNWSYPGEIKRHLIQSHGITPSEAAMMTTAQAELIHSAIHEGYTVQQIRAYARAKGFIR